jgi:Mn-dependent DtxR family transcriptional regulator
MENRAATEVEIANVGILMNVIRLQTCTNQILARLMPHMAHEVMVEALPELFGIVSTEPHGFQWPTDQLAFAQPKEGDLEPERLSEPSAVEMPARTGTRDSAEYSPPEEATPGANGAKAGATATPPEVS